MPNPKLAQVNADALPPEVRAVIERFSGAHERVHGDGAEPTDEDREELREAHAAYRSLVLAQSEIDAYQRAHAPVTISPDAPDGAGQSEE